MNWRELAREEVQAGVRSPAPWVVTGLFVAFVLLLGRMVSRGSLLAGSGLLEANPRLAGFFLTFLFVPIVGLMVSYTALLGEYENDRVSTQELFLGVVAGRAGVLSVVVFAGFLPAFLVLLVQSGITAVLEVFLRFVAAVLFGLLFVAIGVAISTVARSRLQAAGGAVGAFLVLYAWPFVLPVPHAVVETLWPVFIFGDTVSALFSLRNGELGTELLGPLVLLVLVGTALALGYLRLESSPTAAGEEAT
jgi:ABC-2 type transport system permease protein